MKPDILDDTLLLESEKDNKSDLLNWIAVILLWLGMIYSWYVGVLFTPSYLAGLCYLIFATAITCFKFEEGIVFFFFVIFSGILNILSFIPIKYLVTVGASSFGFELILLLIGVLHFYANKSILKAFFNNVLGRDSAKQSKEASTLSQLDGFKSRYSNKSVSELEDIKRNVGLIPIARQAAKELLEAQQNLNGNS